MYKIEFLLINERGVVMSTWIFQGNPKKFNVNDYLQENELIWWSIRQEHLADKIAKGDEVFIWRSDGGVSGSGGIVARTITLSTPKEYMNDEESEKYWYEDVSNKAYLAVKLQVIEVGEKDSLNRLQLKKHPILKNLKILRLSQNTNYFVEDELASYLRQLWYREFEPFDQASKIDKEIIKTRFKVVTEIEQVIRNICQFNEDLTKQDELRRQLKQFQQWYYVLESDLFAPSKFIGYQDMKGHLYTDKVAIIGLDGRETVKILKEYFVSIDNENLRKHLQNSFQGELRKDYEINVLKSEKHIIEQQFSEGNKELVESLTSEESNGIEGEKRFYFGSKYERNEKNRKNAIKIHGLNCYACGFNFEEVYGERGKEFIEVHHTKPLSTLKEKMEINPKTDLFPLCANCHRMIHREKDNYLSIDELKAIIRNQKS